jgi:hypothetical protein
MFIAAILPGLPDRGPKEGLVWGYGQAMAVTAPAEARRQGAEGRWWAEALMAFAIVTLAVCVAVWLGARGPIAASGSHDLSPYPGSGLFGGWFRYDGRWYDIIATQGYSYAGPTTQSPAAFFPAYPLVLWTLHAVTGVSVKLAATLVTIACGAGTVVLFRRWCGDRADRTTAMAAVVTMLLYPYCFYLMGAVYADALFLVATIGAFVLLDRGHPVLAGLAGAVATASRPVGIAVVVGLVAVTLWRNGTISRIGRRLRVDRSTLRPADAGVLLSIGGLIGWMTYLGVRFGHPLAFQEVQQAPGWDQGEGPHTWFKVKWFGEVWNLPRFAHRWLVDSGDDEAFSRMLYAMGILLQGLLLLGFLLLAWRVWKRLGWGYGVYSFVLLAIPLTSTKDFQGTGRYLLAAFPCYLVLAELLMHRRVLQRAVWGVSGAVLLAWAFAFGRGYYVS